MIKRILKFLAKPFLWIEDRWSRCSKWFKRLVVILYVVPSCLLSLIFLYNNIIKENIVEPKVYVSSRQHVSERLRIDHYSDGKKRLYDKKKKEYIMDSMQGRSNFPYGDSLAVIAFQGKSGYINVHTAEIVIEPQYKVAWDFSEGLAAVRNHEGKVGFINNKNEVMIPFKFDAKSDRERKLYVFESGMCVMSDSTGLFGIIDRDGNWLIEPAYDYIDPYTVKGFRGVQKDGLYGLLDSVFNVVYKPIYQHIIVSDILGIQLTTDTSRCLVDYSGKVIVPCMYSRVMVLSYPVSAYGYEGEVTGRTVSDYAKYEVNEKYGLLNTKTGARITSAIYSDIQMISPTLFSVNDGYWNFLIDTKGNVVKQ